MCLNDILLKEIEKLRDKMIEVVFDKGMTSKESLKISQELDRLLNIYHKNK